MHIYSFFFIWQQWTGMYHSTPNIKKKFDFKDKALIFQTRVNKTQYCYRHYIQDFLKTKLFNNSATDAKTRSN